MRRGQGAVLLVAAALPALAFAGVALACLGARVRVERAQRVADAAALAAALGAPPPASSGLRVAVVRSSGVYRAAVDHAVVRLRLPLLRGVASYGVSASAAARPTRTADGRRGAVLVG